MADVVQVFRADIRDWEKNVKSMLKGMEDVDSSDKQLIENQQQRIDLIKQEIEDIKQLRKERESTLRSEEKSVINQRINESVANVKRLGGEYKANQKAVESASKAIREQQKELETLGKVGDDALGKIDRLTGGLITKARGLFNGLKGVSGVLGTMGTAVAGVGITAFAAGLAAVNTYLTSTREGMEQAKIATTAWGAQLSVLSGRFAEMGGNIWSFLGLDEGGGALSLGKILSGPFKMLGFEMQAAAISGRVLAQELIEIQLAELGINESRAQSMRQFRELQKMGDDRNKSIESRIMFHKSAASVMKEQMDTEEAFLQRKIKATREQFFLDNASRAEEDLTIEQLATISKMEIQRDNMRARSLWQQNFAAKRVQSLQEQEQKRLQKLIELDRERAQEIQEFDRQVLRDEQETAGDIDPWLVQQIDLEIEAIDEKKKRQEEFIEWDKEQSSLREQEEYDRLQREQDAYDEAWELRLNTVREGSANITGALVSLSETRVQTLERELANAEDIRKEAIEEQLEQEKDRLRELKSLQLAALFISEAVAVGRSFEQLGPIAGAFAAIGLVAKFGALQAQINAESFEEGTDFLTRPKGVKPGTDTIPIWADEGEAIVSKKRNKQYRGLVKELVKGDPEQYINRKYVLPQLKGAFSGAESMSVLAKLNDRNILDRLDRTNRDQNRNFNTLIREMRTNQKSKNRIGAI